MTLPTYNTSNSKSVEVLCNGEIYQPLAAQTLTQCDPANGLTARIRRHMATKGYASRPPALITPGALA